MIKNNTTEVVVAIANKLVEVRRALDASNYKRKQHLSRTVEKTLQEIEQNFGNKRYDEASHLINVIKILIAREAPIFAADPQKWAEKYKTLKETVLING